MRSNTDVNDFEELFKDSELDSAQMVLRLAGELKQKELEIAAARAKAYEEAGAAGKIREAELEALMKEQEGRMAKREQELSRLLIDKESALWQKHQKLLEEAVSIHRDETEKERIRLNAEAAAKEAELLRQRRELRIEAETAFRNWETERETDFKKEREALVRDIKLAREAALSETDGRVRQIEEVLRHNLALKVAELEAGFKQEKEELEKNLRRENAEELKALARKLCAEFENKERLARADSDARLADAKKAMAGGLIEKAERLEHDYGAQLKDLSETLEITRAELARTTLQWENRNTELKKACAEKEAALELSALQTQDFLAKREKELLARHEAAAQEIQAERERLLADFAKKERNLDQAFRNKTEEFSQITQAGQQDLENREARLLSDRAELNLFREQIGQILSQRQTELQQTLDERYALLRQSLEESYKIKELSLTKKYEDMERQFSVLNSQKDAAVSKAVSLSDELARVKDAVAEKGNSLRAAAEKERAAIREERARAEAEIAARSENFHEDLAAREKALRSSFEEKLAAEAQRLDRQLKVKETALEQQRREMAAQSVAMETRFLDALKAKETEISANFRKNIESLRELAAQAQERHAAEIQAVENAAGLREEKLRAEFSEISKKREAEMAARCETRETEIKNKLLAEMALERDRAAAEAELKLRASEAAAARVGEALRLAETALQARREETDKLKESLDLAAMRFEKSEQEKQTLYHDGLHKSGELRQIIEQQYHERIKVVEDNYLTQLADMARRAEASTQEAQAEYFKKLEFMKEEYLTHLENQERKLEETYLVRERKLTASLAESYKLKEKALLTRQEQLEKSYEALVSENASQLDTDRSMADNITRLKEDLEAKNAKLNNIINSYNARLELAEEKFRSEYETHKKELSDSHRVKVSQLENERSKIKSLLEQEQQIVSDLQKREAALQENYSQKEAEMAKRFQEARSRLEGDYQARLKDIGRP